MLPPFDDLLEEITPLVADLAPSEPQPLERGFELPIIQGQLSDDEIRGIHQMFIQARSFKSPLQSRIAEWRKYMDMVPPNPPYKDALTVTVPVIRQKADGIRAHIQMSIDRSPFFTAKPLSSEAADISSALEAVVENELTVTESKINIDRAIADAVVFGTGILKIEPNNAGMISLRYVPIQNVFAWPDKPEPSKLFWFHFYYLPYWEMQRLANMGYLDKQGVESLKDQPANNSFADEETDISMDASFFATNEHRWHGVVEGWGILNGKLIQVIYHPSTLTVLRYEVDPYEGAFETPPFFPIYIAPSTISVWGQGIAEVLASNQVVADAMLNNELWNAQYKMNPSIFVKAGSQLHRQIQKAGGIFPGQIIPFDGVELDEVFRIPEYSANPFNLQMFTLVNQLTEDATISDFVVPGQPLGGRKTATEVSVTATIGQLKLANFLRQVQRSLEAVGDAYWRAIVKARIKTAAEPNLPRGVFSVFSHNGGGRVYLAENTVDFIMETQEGAMQVYIPAAKRDDFQWKLTGSITVPERELRLSRLMMFINPAMIQIIQVARQDPGIHTLMRRILNEMNLGQDVDAILGPPPEQASPGQAALMGLLQGLTGTPNEEEQNVR